MNVGRSSGGTLVLVELQGPDDVVLKDVENGFDAPGAEGTPAPSPLDTKRRATLSMSFKSMLAKRSGPSSSGPPGY